LVEPFLGTTTTPGTVPILRSRVSHHLA
jgi:hypothetical protein